MAHSAKFLNVINQLNTAGTVRFFEIATIYWQGATQTRHYSDAPWDQDFPALVGHGISPVAAVFQREDWFADIARSNETTDDVVSLKMWDADYAISDLYHAVNSGEGTRVVIRQYFPDQDLLKEIFWGFLKAPKESEGVFFTVEVATGIRSPNLQVPKRANYPGCQALFGGLKDPAGNYYFDTQAKIDAGDCPYNRHIGGSIGNLNPVGGVPYETCPRSRPSDCSTRIPTPPSLPYLGFDVAIESNVIGQGFRSFVATTRGNENLLKQPLSVAYGKRWLKDLKLMAYAPESGSANPENGFLRTLWQICEGPIVGLQAAPSDPNLPQTPGPTPPNPGTSTVWSGMVVNSQWVEVRHCHFGGSWGYKRQGPTDFSVNVLNYSSTSVIRVNYGRIDSRGFSPDDIEARAYGQWQKEIRVYTTPTTYSSKWTDNRAWCLLDLLTKRRYGMGFAFSLFNLQDWIDLAAYCDEMVNSIDEAGNSVAVRRTHFNAQVDEMKAGELLRAICGPGYFSLPYHHEGLIRITPLEVAVPVDLPVFAETGDERNIVFEDNRSSIRYSRESDSKIPNEIKLNFDDEAYQNLERPLQINDNTAQLKAGRASGDDTFRPVPKEYSAFGVTNFAMAARYARRLLDLGEFEQGGTRNNFKVTFKTWSPFVDDVGVHPYSLIRISSPTINRFTEPGGEPYEVFRVLKLRRRRDLIMEVECVLYPQGYISSYLNWQPAPVADNPGGSREAPPKEIELINVTGTAGLLKFTADIKPPV